MGPNIYFIKPGEGLVSLLTRIEVDRLEEADWAETHGGDPADILTGYIPRSVVANPPREWEVVLRAKGLQIRRDIEPIVVNRHLAM